MSSTCLHPVPRDACFPARCQRQQASQLLLFLALILLCTGGISQAATKPAVPLRGIVGKDDRKPVEQDGKGWSAIGHVNIQGYRISEQCTGTRVAPGLVLTAAHCVFNWQRNALHAARNIHFIAGVDINKNAGHAVADCVLLPTGFKSQTESRMNADLKMRWVTTEFLRHDLALIVLKSDTPAAGVIAMAPREMQEGQPVIHAGYHRDRRQKLLADDGCKVKQASGELVATDCDAVAGSSGGPVLIEKDGRLEASAVMVAIGDGSTLAVSLTAWPDIPMTAACP